MKRPVIILVSLVLLTLIVGYWLVLPAYRAWDGAKRGLRGVETELETLNKQQNLIKKLEAAEPTLGQQSQAAQALIPIQENRETFVGEVDAIAKASGVNLATFNFSSTSDVAKKSADETDQATTTKPTKASPTTATKTSKAKPSLNPTNYTATITGPYPAVDQFLVQLERTKRYNSVKTFEVAGTTSQGLPTSELTVTITGAIYTDSAPKIPKDLSFATTVWQFLVDRSLGLDPAVTPVSVGSGRADPFAAYQ